MMHDKWCSLFGTGCLMAVLVLFGSTEASAQPSGNFGATASDVTIEVTPVAGKSDSVLVEWPEWVPGDDEADGYVAATSLQVGYLAHKTAATFGAAAPMTISVPGGLGVTQAVISDLDGGTRYLFSVRAMSADDMYTTWGQNGTDDVGAFGIETTPAGDPPGNVDHRYVMITPGDKMLMVKWDAPLSAGGTNRVIEDYMVHFSMDKKTWKDWPHTSAEPMTTITGLMNDTMYYVRIKAMNDFDEASAKWSEPVMGTPSADAQTPTPALPLFGAFTLGAGLLAAGRARLRRREQRQLLTRC